MDWSSLLKGFKSYLKLERSLSSHSVSAYIRDTEKLALFAKEKKENRSAIHFKHDDISEFVIWLQQFQLDNKSQARILSGIRAFYKYLLIEDLINDDPTDLIEGPKLGRTLPDTLSIEEIEQVIAAIDLSTDRGHRDKAIIETLYACGLRVSELTDLKFSQLFEDLAVVRVHGKGNKERIVPIGEQALKQILLYKNSDRNKLPVVKNHEDFIFLNRFGKKLSRISIFNIIKELVQKAGIRKIISPHTFRHSFASHLVEGGANLRAVQEMLGHESITTTEIYTHLDTQFLHQTVLKYHPRNRKEVRSS